MYYDDIIVEIFLNNYLMLNIPIKTKLISSMCIYVVVKVYMCVCKNKYK